MFENGGKYEKKRIFCQPCKRQKFDEVGRCNHKRSQNNTHAEAWRRSERLKQMILSASVETTSWFLPSGIATFPVRLYNLA